MMELVPSHSHSVAHMTPFVNQALVLHWDALVRKIFALQVPERNPGLDAFGDRCTPGAGAIER